MKESRPNGHGKLTDPDRNQVYEGIFSEGMMNNEFKVKFGCRSVYTGGVSTNVIDDEDGTLLSDNGDFYRGSIKQNKPFGKELTIEGLLTKACGEEIEGTFIIDVCVTDEDDDFWGGGNTGGGGRRREADYGFNLGRSGIAYGMVGLGSLWSPILGPNSHIFGYPTPARQLFRNLSQKNSVSQIRPLTVIDQVRILEKAERLSKPTFNGYNQLSDYSLKLRARMINKVRKPLMTRVFSRSMLGKQFPLSLLRLVKK